MTSNDPSNIATLILAILVGCATVLTNLLSQRKMAKSSSVEKVEGSVVLLESAVLLLKSKVTECEEDRHRLRGEVDHLRNDNLSLASIVISTAKQDVKAALKKAGKTDTEET